MRILYGAFAQGHGHFSKAAVIVPVLESRGHEVRLISSGNPTPPAGYHFNWHRHFPGLAYELSNGGADYKRTFVKWVREVPQVMSHLFHVRNIVRDFEPDVIVSDFEPLTASPLIQPKCEVIALSRQVALSDRAVPLPREMPWERKMTRTVIRLFTAGADRRHGYHYQPLSYRCVPPIIRPELKTHPIELGDHIVVYNSFHTVDSGTPEALLEWSKRTRVPVRAYGFPEMPRGQQGGVWFRPPSRDGMIDDIATSRAVITSAGLTTAVEAFLLNKPVCTVPIPNQWEQLVNSFHLQEAGIARWCTSWDYDQLLEVPPPGKSHPLNDWLNTPVEHVLDHVLGGGVGPMTPQPVTKSSVAAA